MSERVRLDGSNHSAKTAWSISSWAHGDLYDLVKYKAELVGLGVETVNPLGASRYCPRCGELGDTVGAPDDHTEMRSGGHFHCPECGYECDRDVVGAINVGRKYLDNLRMEGANPAAYMEAGDHASFPSHIGCDRSAASVGKETAEVSGVQSTTDPSKKGEQDVVSGRQHPASQHRSPLLTVKQDGTTRGGLHGNYSGNTGLRWPSTSITEWCLLTSTTADHAAMLSSPTEN